MSIPSCVEGWLETDRNILQIWAEWAVCASWYLHLPWYKILQQNESYFNNLHINWTGKFMSLKHFVRQELWNLDVCSVCCLFIHIILHYCIVCMQYACIHVAWDDKYLWKMTFAAVKMIFTTARIWAEMRQVKLASSCFSRLYPLLYYIKARHLIYKLA